jgi:hypothetical protein
MNEEKMLQTMTSLLEKYKSTYPTINFSWELLKSVEQLNIYESLERGENIFIRPSENPHNRQFERNVSTIKQMK